MSISQANHPTEQIVPQQQHQLPLKRQPLFSSMKSPFGDYHQFSSSALDLRRKSEKVDLVAKSSDWNPSTGYVEAVGSPLQTPVSRKGEKAQKVPRMAKSNRSGSQTPVSNVVLLRAIILLQLVPVVMIAPSIIFASSNKKVHQSDQTC